MMETALLEARRLRLTYGRRFTLEIEELAIPPGEIFCVLGPTGSGKSTLLRILAGLERPGDGEVRFQRRALYAGDMPLSMRRRITMVFQRPLLISGSVRRNVEYGLWLRGRRRDYGDRVDVLLERLGLADRAAQAANTLSAGQTQLTALARALAVEPDLLLLDEPTANLDPAHVALVEDVVREDRTRRGTTVVWASHNIFQARRAAGRVGLLLNGRLIETATTARFFESPSDPRTADFVQGKMIC